ncbi:M3 family oligoendopeptidase [Aestuariispira insulae]|nr:M3 family oligoendopeptidase [Aestuariispira insulae]
MEKTLDNLPEWDLSDLYPGMDSPELDHDMVQSFEKAEEFSSRYQGKVAGLDAAALAKAIREYENLDETLSRVMSYAYLVYAGDVTDSEIGRFFQNCQEKVNDISSHLLFFTLEINRLDEAILNSMLDEAAELAHYRPWLRDVRALRDHQLSDELEKLLHEKSVSGKAAWIRLFDETLASLRFPCQGREMTATEALNLMHDQDATVRKEAAQTVGKVLGANIRIFTHITNTLAKDKSVEDSWRGFDRPVSARNLSNYVEDEVVDALVSAVKDAYPRLSHRYYRLKAKWLGQERLDYWDRLAPLPDEDDGVISWDQAQETVLSAYGRFSPDLAAIGQKFFDNAWIDVPARPGKASGAFAHPTVPSAHPYLLLNYQGKTRDVMTLAHELGHGVHQVLAGDQGHLMSDTPLTLAETASVFGEMLTFKGMLSQEDDPKKRRAMLAAKVEDMLNTVVRQVAFFDFERQVHDARLQGELTADQLGDIWMKVSEESLGDALCFDEGYRTFWSYIPHFIHSPFYVYAYAFGDCLVNSLYALYENADEGFVEKYFDMLRAGGTLRHKELLAPFGLDASDPAFWSKGLDVIAGFIDELEKEA